MTSEKRLKKKIFVPAHILIKESTLTFQFLLILKILKMANENFLEKLAAQLAQSASVKNVYGEPIRAGDKTIVPVAQIAYGFGGGYGHGKNKMKPKTEPAETNQNGGEGAGGGGGIMAKPKGVYEITPTCTRFI